MNQIEEIRSIDEIKECVESWAGNDNIQNISKDVYVVHVRYLLSLLEWTKVEDGLPEKTGYYLTCYGKEDYNKHKIDKLQIFLVS